MTPAWIVIAILLLHTGCAETEGIQGSLHSHSSHLAYLYDSTNVSEKQPAAIRVSSVTVDDVLPPSTTVRKESGYFLPFLIVNVWKYEYESQLGHAQISNDYKAFFQESLIEELKRSGKYRYSESDSEIELDLKIRSVTMTAPLRKTGNLLFLLYAVSFNQTYYAGPVDVRITGEAVLKKKGSELYRQEVQGRGRAGMLQVKNVKLGDYTITMIEALSAAIKDLNERIVTEVNKN